MFTMRLVAIAVTLETACAGSASAAAQTDRSGCAAVNGLSTYYEIRGAGQPLVLLYGALMTIEGFGEPPPWLAQCRQVIAVEQRAHGRTA